MKVTDAYVDWKHGYGNNPRLHVLVDDIPSRSDLTFQSAKDDRVWYGEKDGYADFFAGHPEEPGDGYSGRKFRVNTPNGEVVLKGPYSSRAGVMNDIGFGPVMDVAMTDDPRVMEKGHTFTAGAITVEKAREAVEMMEGVMLEKQDSYGEPVWVPVLENDYVAAVDNTVHRIIRDSSNSEVVDVSSLDYAVCRNVYEYSNEDWWVVPITRDDNGRIIESNDRRFTVEGGELVQKTSITR